MFCRLLEEVGLERRLAEKVCILFVSLVVGAASPFCVFFPHNEVCRRLDGSLMSNQVSAAQRNIPGKDRSFESDACVLVSMDSALCIDMAFER